MPAAKGVAPPKGSFQEISVKAYWVYSDHIPGLRYLVIIGADFTGCTCRWYLENHGLECKHIERRKAGA